MSTPAFNMSMATLGDNETTATGAMSKGESAIFRVDITPVDKEMTNLLIKFLTPTNTTQPMEICSVNIVHAGRNIPCLQRGSINGYFESRHVSFTIVLRFSKSVVLIPVPSILPITFIS